MSTPSRSYKSYIQLPVILSAQRPLSPPSDTATWTAERYFIVCHQASELLASQILTDLEHAAHLDPLPGDWVAVSMFLTRGASLTLLLCRHLEQLVYLCPRNDFLKFRDTLGGSSAGESEQFRQILSIFDEANPHRRNIETALARQKPCFLAFVPAVFAGCLHHECISAEALRVLVDGVGVWRRLHVLIAAHFIGHSPGTGGTAGVEYLLRRMSTIASEKAFGSNQCSRLIQDQSSATLPDITIERLTMELYALEERARALNNPFSKLAELQESVASAL